MHPSTAPAGPASVGPDTESVEWLRELRGVGQLHEVAVGRLHALLVRAARHEVQRRNRGVGILDIELDDLAHQAAADAVVAILAKLDTFRGESRFTTWAYAFVVFQVAGKLARHHWNGRPVWLGDEDWARLPQRFGLDPPHEAEWGELMAAVHRAVDGGLTGHQRRLFVAVVLHGVPLDVLVAEAGVNRNAIYKVVFDARRKIRSELVANGLLHAPGSVRTVASR